MSEQLNEVTLHGKLELMKRRVKVLTEESLKYRYTDPERYLLLRNMALQIQDQIEEWPCGRGSLVG